MDNDYRLTTKFGWHDIYRQVSQTMNKWGVFTWNVNEPKGVRYPNSYQSEEDRTVIIDYKHKGKNIRLVMGKQNSARDNFRVLAIALEAMRMNEKRGIGEVMESAYKQLSGSVQEGYLNPYQVLGLNRGLPISVYEAMYKDIARKAHPDTGGTPEEFKKLNNAMELIRKDFIGI